MLTLRLKSCWHTLFDSKLFELVCSINTVGLFLFQVYIDSMKFLLFVITLILSSGLQTVYAEDEHKDDKVSADEGEEKSRNETADSLPDTINIVSSRGQSCMSQLENRRIRVCSSPITLESKLFVTVTRIEFESLFKMLKWSLSPPKLDFF